MSKEGKLQFPFGVEFSLVGFLSPVAKYSFLSRRRGYRTERESTPHGRIALFSATPVNPGLACALAIKVLFLGGGRVVYATGVLYMRFGSYDFPLSGFYYCLNSGLHLRAFR